MGYGLYAGKHHAAAADGPGDVAAAKRAKPAAAKPTPAGSNWAMLSKVNARVHPLNPLVREGRGYLGVADGALRRRGERRIAKGGARLTRWRLCRLERSASLTWAR